VILVNKLVEVMNRARPGRLAAD